MASPIGRPGVNVSTKEASATISALFERVKNFSSLSVTVGYTDPEIAKIAAINEYGSEHIPSRPFMRRAADVEGAALGRATTRALEQAASGKISEVEAAEKVGSAVHAAVIRSLKSTRSWAKPNAPSTNAKKGAYPPLHAGHDRLEHGLTYQVRKRGGIVAEGGGT